MITRLNNGGRDHSDCLGMLELLVLTDWSVVISMICEILAKVLSSPRVFIGDPVVSTSYKADPGLMAF